MKINFNTQIKNIDFIQKSKNNTAQIQNHRTFSAPISNNNVHFGSCITQKTGSEPSLQELEEIHDIEKTAALPVQDYDKKLQTVNERIYELKEKMDSEIEEVKELYKNNKTKTRNSSKKIEIKNDTMLEYDSSGKTVIRKTVFNKNACGFEAKKNIFTGNFYMKKTKVLSVKHIVKRNEDDSFDIITPDVYKKGCKKLPNGTEKFDEAYSSRTPSNTDAEATRCYVKGYSKNPDGSEIRKLSVYKEPNPMMPAILLENEKQSPDGTITADTKFRLNIPYCGCPHAEYFENYMKNHDSMSCSKYVKTMLTDSVVEYKENYKQSKTSGEEWSKYYKQNKSGEWETINLQDTIYL